MTDKPETKILALDRGHVLVGQIVPHPTLAFHWLVSPGRTIRRWGTSAGLPELAKGPLENTVLDAVGTFSVPWRALLFLIDVEESMWLDYLRPGAGTPTARRR